MLHHEREDGSGYPFGLKGDRIHEIAKIIAVADIYDAMTSNRYYKEKRCPFEVIEYIEKEHLGTLDHRITSTFLRNIASYYIGEHARLSSGETGVPTTFQSLSSNVQTGTSICRPTARSG